jgi:hypothetical protein
MVPFVSPTVVMMLYLGGLMLFMLLLGGSRSVRVIVRRFGVLVFRVYLDVVMLVLSIFEQQPLVFETVPECPLRPQRSTRTEPQTSPTSSLTLH